MRVISYKLEERTWCVKHLRTGNDPCSRRRELFPPYVTPSRLAGATIKLYLKSIQFRYKPLSIPVIWPYSSNNLSLPQYSFYTGFYYILGLYQIDLPSCLVGYRQMYDRACFPFFFAPRAFTISHFLTLTFG